MPRKDASRAAILLEVDAAEARDLRLTLPSRADNVAVVRQAMTGVTEALGIDAGVLADMKTAVSEACNNVVVHAYDGEDGPLRVRIAPRSGTVEVTVVDDGKGIPEGREEPDEDDDGVGLSLIAALSDDVEIGARDEGGTAVRMTFATDPGAAPSAPPGPVLAAVLGRVIAMLAARADFSLDRLSDAQLVSDAISAHAPGHAADGVLRVAVDDGARALEVRVGPLAGEGGAQVVRDSDLPGVGQLLEQLVDDLRVEPGQAGGELLVLRLSESG